MLRRCAETFKTTSEISKSKLVLIHALFDIWTLHPIKNEKLKGCMTTEIQIVSSTVYMNCSKYIQTKINKGGLHLELELLKRFEAVQMEIELHICNFQNPISLFL